MLRWGPRRDIQDQPAGQGRLSENALNTPRPPATDSPRSKYASARSSYVVRRVGTQTCCQLSGSAAQGSITARHQGFTEEERPWRQPSHFNARNLIVAERLGYTLEVPSQMGDTKSTVETRAVEITRESWRYKGERGLKGCSCASVPSTGHTQSHERLVIALAPPAWSLE